MKLEKNMNNYKFQAESNQLKESDTGESYELKEQEWENERRMLMSLIEKNQEYAYNAQEKWKLENERNQKQYSDLKAQLEPQIQSLETENGNLKKLLNEVHISEEDKGNEVKMVRANLIEEIFRVQNIHQRNEDDLRKDNDKLSIKYSDSINSFKELFQKAQADNEMQKKIQGIINESKQTESDLIFQINDLNRTNNKLVKAFEVKSKETLDKSRAADTTRRSDIFSSFDRSEYENIDSSIGQVIASSNKTVETLEKQFREKSSKWKKEKEKLLDEIEKRENIYAEKLALRDMEMDKVKNVYGRQRRLEDTKTSTLVKENKIIDKALKGNS